jgi:tRNA pseudouridine38-40 synthase
MNIACGIEYDGTNYHGFQRQPDTHGLTVQGVLETAIRQVSGAMSVIHGAGRTDAGVHANGQVVHFYTNSHLSVEVWQRALNAVLPNDVAVRWTKEMPERFHARFSARSRSYRYTVWNASAPSPLHVRYSYYRSMPLDVAAMHEGCQLLQGRKDFGAFGRSPDETNPQRPGPHSCVRTLLEARCTRDVENASCVYYDFTADGFLTGMVRRMVGTLLLVGQERLCLEEFEQIVQRAQKSHPGAAAPAHGLCLVRVEYPEEFGVTYT